MKRLLFSLALGTFALPLAADDDGSCWTTLEKHKLEIVGEYQTAIAGCNTLQYNVAMCYGVASLQRQTALDRAYRIYNHCVLMAPE